jgi:hypothetical protein
MNQNPVKPLPLSAIASCIISASLGTAGTSATKHALNPGAMVQPVPLDAKFAQLGYLVWCGAPARGADKKDHLFYIGVAIADKPEGAWRRFDQPGLRQCCCGGSNSMAGNPPI